MRSLYLETRLLPTIAEGAPVQIVYPDGTTYEFTARETVDGADFQRLELQRIHVDGLGTATFEGAEVVELRTELSTGKGKERSKA